MKNLNKLNNSTKFAPRQSMHPDGDVTQAMNKQRARRLKRRNRSVSFSRLRKVLRDYADYRAQYPMRNM